MTACKGRQHSPVLCMHQGLFILYCFIPCHWSSLLPFAALGYRMSLMGPKQSRYLSAQQDLVYAINIETNDKGGNKIYTFFNCSFLASDATINMSVHQVFEEKVSLNFIYLFQSPETTTYLAI